MQNSTLKKLIMNGLMIALVFLATYFTRIPTMILPEVTSILAMR